MSTEHSSTEHTGTPASSADTVAGLLGQIADVGRDPKRGGYSRPVHSDAEHTLREWFREQAARRGLDVETDRNGTIWAWHAPGGRRENAVVTGSHLDSVPGGGAYDGPLGIASALVAFDRLAERGTGGARAIAVFGEEEGSRFGVACLGSRLATGAISPERALALTDADGRTYAEVAERSGLDPTHMGPDPDTLARMAAFVELHVEQGRGLVDLGSPVAVATSILGHGRWRISISGEGNHAGTTLMTDRRDPMIAAGALVVRVRDLARAEPGARATVGRLQPIPGGTNVIASRVDVWLDVRHPEDAVTAALVEQIGAEASRLAADEGCTATLTEESFGGTVDFDAGLRDRLAARLGDVPLLPTGAGHDAGVLNAHVPTAMLFTRNPTGVSHAPDEGCEDTDAEAGAEALADSMELLADTASTAPERPLP
ncbi:allantoate amidohydrolase [Saccharomonospora sp. CUA-673]|uniref:allantoate amidohydrolase n=1 Tax=Saccharomonospora sp. CUA-673 TaxID=1904969 RepID=UPI000966DD84|nr:allantoate amidohydrolase [Saccharomonospora sp. CUA-673]OLT49252.1 allantoate amidohydrolase [Saccharomonospora sp. CUA-673]